MAKLTWAKVTGGETTYLDGVAGEGSRLLFSTAGVSATGPLDDDDRTAA